MAEGKTTKGVAAAKPRGSMQEVYQRLGHLEMETSAFQAEVRTGLAGLREIVESLATKLDQVTGRVNRPVNWGWIMAAVVAVVTITGAVVRLGASGHIDNLEELRLEKRLEHIRALDAARREGAQEAELAELKRRLEALEADAAGR